MYAATSFASHADFWFSRNSKRDPPIDSDKSCRLINKFMGKNNKKTGLEQPIFFQIRVNYVEQQPQSIYEYTN
jgi:hypothetical protein